MMKKRKTNLEHLLFLVLWIAISLSLGGCKTKYVTVPEYHTEYITKIDSTIKWDSIWVHDSVSLFIKGDTITKYQLKDKIVYKYLWKYQTDTLLQRDSIRVPYPVEKKLSKWEKVKMDMGGIALFVGCLAIIYFLFKVIRWLHARRG